MQIGLEVLEVGERGEVRRRATRDFAHDMPLENASLVREFFEEGEGVG